MKNYVGIEDAAKKLATGYVGVNSVARKLVKGYVGVNGVAKRIWNHVFYWIELPLTIHQSDGHSYRLYFYSNVGNPDVYKETSTFFFNGTIRFTSSGQVDTSSMEKATISYNDTSQLDRYEWYYNKTYNAVGKVAGYRKTAEERTSGEIEYCVITNESYGSLYFVEAIENGGFNIVTSTNESSYPDGGCRGSNYYLRYYPDDPNCFSGSISVNVTDADNAVFKFIQTEPNGVIITTSDGYTYRSAGTGLVKVYVPKTVSRKITLTRDKGLFIPCSTVSTSATPREYYAGCIRGSYTDGAVDMLNNLYSDLTVSGRFKKLYGNSLMIPLTYGLNNAVITDIKVYAGTENINSDSILLPRTGNGASYFYYGEDDAVEAFAPTVTKGTSKGSLSYECYTDNSIIRNYLLGKADEYTIVTVKHLNGSDW